MTRPLTDIVFIGAGNVATHLCLILAEQYRIRQVFSRTERSAKELADSVGARWTADPGALDYSAGAYFFCLPDDRLQPVLNLLNFNDQLLIHTSGSVPMDIFRGHSSNYGVVYPVQTFSKDRPVNLELVPVCIEANTGYNEEILRDLAGNISRDIQVTGSEKRKIIHIAAVIACNFTNHMYAEAARLLADNQLDFELLKPLILETAQKVMDMQPGDAQTGPARRNDQKVMEEHINTLRDSPELQKLYSFVSRSISESDHDPGE